MQCSEDMRVVGAVGGHALTVHRCMHSQTPTSLVQKNAGGWSDFDVFIMSRSQRPRQSGCVRAFSHQSGVLYTETAVGQFEVCRTPNCLNLLCGHGPGRPNSPSNFRFACKISPSKYSAHAHVPQCEKSARQSYSMLFFFITQMLAFQVHSLGCDSFL